MRESSLQILLFFEGLMLLVLDYMIQTRSFVVLKSIMQKGDITRHSHKPARLST
jgi:hypothetical protein